MEVFRGGFRLFNQHISLRITLQYCFFEQRKLKLSYRMELPEYEIGSLLPSTRDYSSRARQIPTFSAPSPSGSVGLNLDPRYQLLPNLATAQSRVITTPEKKPISFPTTQLQFEKKNHISR